VYDPVAMRKAESVLKQVTYCKSAYEAAAGADCLALVTEWPEFRTLNFGRIKRSMTHPILMDGRNLYDGARMKALGFEYHGMGRFS
jgi:UDPglucose 6-dehydrogenase